MTSTMPRWLQKPTSIHTVSMSDKDLLYFAHFQRAFLDLMLSSLSAIEKPDVTIDANSEGGMVASRGRLC